VEDETGWTALLLLRPAATRRRFEAAPATGSRRKHHLQLGHAAEGGAWAGGRRAAEGERRGRAVPRARLARGGRRAPVLWRRQAGWYSLDTEYYLGFLDSINASLCLVVLW
jgi:hypothetical protein